MKRIRSADLSLVFIFAFSVLFSTGCSDLVISKLDRQVENSGVDEVSEILLPFLSATVSEGKGKPKDSSVSVPVVVRTPEGRPPTMTQNFRYLINTTVLYLD